MVSNTFYTEDSFNNAIIMVKKALKGPTGRVFFPSSLSCEKFR